ncbi:flagellin [Nocardioides sp. Kera G14]|uniref:flagellin N-terminal helical domain-containing protein n=1 Tax=Nocardioides sp. Kera G14 TaxID=2884264 RepID=UPI001D0F7C78|nr:flagellin [Nocardioides sp. Kera G14]UDY24083.1 flagellin [Nocardioides sp. Kera G14]
MSLRINTNIDALTAYRNLTSTQSSMSTSVERLSSGLRINKAADDAAGLAISQGLTAQINGTGQAVRNAQDGINVVQTADGALSETQSILQRVRTLTVQGANDSNDSAAKGNIVTEIGQLSKELDRIANTTEFNGNKILSGSANLHFQIGARSVTNQAGNQLNIDLTKTGTNKVDLSGSALLGAAANLKGSDDATTWSNALDDLDKGLQNVSTLRANLGAYQNRLQHTINNLSVTQTNLQASNSAIQDTDMASEMSNYTRTQILSQAGTSMLSKANQNAQSVLSLLQ